MSDPKQVLVVRKDLNMRKGKIAAQASHASLAVILDQMSETETNSGTKRTLTTKRGDALHEWLENKFTKICVSVDSEQELLNIYQQAKSNGVICSLIKDAGLTEFNGVPTLTAAAIGPDKPEIIDKITGHLKLL